MTAVRIPDTLLAREAQAILSGAASEPIVNHSHRAFLLGVGYAERRGIRFDMEGLFLAAMFHDLGLFPGDHDSRRAFPLNSSRALRRFLETRSVPLQRIDALTDAVDFHMQIFPRWARGPEAGLLQVGAWMDVTGLRRWAIDRDRRRAVEGAYPRGAFFTEFNRRLLGSLHGWGCVAGLWAPERYRNRSVV